MARTDLGLGSVIDARVDLSGPMGNAFAILGLCKSLMRQAKIELPEQDEFFKNATSGNYSHLLKTVDEYFGSSLSDQNEILRLEREEEDGS